jgi:TRAP-type C4-dicarboxylate transport system permease large subunit
MTDVNLFVWWAAIISGGSIFQVLVAIYIYIKQRKRRKESKKIANNVDLLKNFIFVWILIGLLVFYIISIKIGSANLFAAGNIFVEVILIIYLMKNKLAE